MRIKESQIIGYPIFKKILQNTGMTEALVFGKLFHDSNNGTGEAILKGDELGKTFGVTRKVIYTALKKLRDSGLVFCREVVFNSDDGNPKKLNGRYHVYSVNFEHEFLKH